MVDSETYERKASGVDLRFAWDRVMNKQRKYRRVFDRYELNYLSVAIEFYNKLFDEKDWDTTITFKAFRLNGDERVKELCNQEKELSVSKDQNLVIYDFGWGNDEYGKYWDKGDYMWEVSIGDDDPQTVKFHIEDAGRVTLVENPYFEVALIRAS